MPFKVTLQYDEFSEFNDEGWEYREADSKTLAEDLPTYKDALQRLVNFDADNDLRTNDGNPPGHRLVIEYTPGDTPVFDYERGYFYFNAD